MTGWRKSSYSMANGDCVEVAEAGGLVLVRDSRSPAGPFLAFSRPDWSALLVEARSMGPKEGGSGAHEGKSSDGKGGKPWGGGKHEAGGKDGKGGK